MVIEEPTGRISPTMIDTTTALNRWVRSADNDAFQELLHAYRPMVMGICQRVLGRCQTADDAMQETFIKLARQAYTVHSNLGSWLYTCALNESRQLLRENENLRGAKAIDEDAASQEHALVLDSDEHQLLHTCIAELEEQDRDVICLHFFLGMTQEQVAKRYSISQPAVVKRLDRALRYLRLRILAHGLRLNGIFESRAPKFISLFDWRMASLIVAVTGYGIYSPTAIRQAYLLARDNEMDAESKEALDKGMLASVCLTLTKKHHMAGGQPIWNSCHSSNHSPSQWLVHLVMDAGIALREMTMMTWYIIGDFFRRQGGSLNRVNFRQTLRKPASRSIVADARR